MPKAPSKTRRKESTSLSLSALNTIKEDSKSAHGTASNTKTRYEGYIRRAREWLVELLAKTTATDDIDHPWSITDLAQAFDIVPTRASPWATASYMTFKCFEQNNGTATAEGIHAAFKKFWDNSNIEGKYRGEWKWDEERKSCSGNPASSPDVMMTLRAIKRKYGVEGSQNHSTAMSIEHLDRIYVWSQVQCTMQFPLPAAESLTLSERMNLYKHLGWRAFSSLSWSLWTRNSETLNLQYCHLNFDPLLQDRSKKPFWYITLEHRKNWENKLEANGTSGGRRYRIFPQLMLPAADVDYHMRVWVSFLQTHVYGRILQSNDWLFPSVSSNGIIHPQTHMSHDIIQNWINEFTSGAGIHNVHFTTHCFRHGGAQYRFTHAPALERWSLDTVRWWGGWAEGEQTDTLMRYLMDDLASYEHNYEDALDPGRTKIDNSFMGAQRDLKPATFEDIKLMMSSFERYVYMRESGLSNQAAQTLPENRVKQVKTSCSRHSQLLTLEQTPDPSSSQHKTLSQDVSPFPSSTLSPSNNKSPPPGLCIPKLTGVPFSERWKLVIKQWDTADPSAGLLVPLKDWEHEWKISEAFAMTYHNRRLIALEFIENCNRDPTLFLQRWPMAEKGPTALYDALTKARLKAGQAKSRKRKGGNESSEKERDFTLK